MPTTQFLTKKEIITGSVSVWAQPRTAKEIQEGNEPFMYSLDTRSAVWMSDNETCVFTSDDVQIEIPAGIDLLERTIATLKEKQEAVLAAAHIRSKEIQTQINNLSLLTYQPIDSNHEKNLDAVPIPVYRDGLELPF